MQRAAQRVGHRRKLPEAESSQTNVHRIEMGKRFHSSTKIDRDPGFIDDLFALGNQRCETFLQNRQSDCRLSADSATNFVRL
ncbi:hypothetical protein Hrd1104_04365 [Halorhabdus sp. CBA1104]|nr:hypothetical protein Hrd1104_04365 [Halorhabdus sp. CBA1104]